MLQSLVNVDGKECLVDKGTGEVLAKSPEDGRAVWVKTRKLRDKSFVILMDLDLEKIASMKLSPTAWRLFYLCLQCSEFENWVHMSLADMARALDVCRQVIYMAMSQLKFSGMMRQELDRLGIMRWRVDPAIAWRGSVDDQIKSLIAFSMPGQEAQTKISVSADNVGSGDASAKCVCGALIQNADCDDLDAWLVLHENCSIEMEFWTEDLEIKQRKA